MRNIKYFLLAALLAVLILPSFASAMTAEELIAKIKDLQQQIEQLKAQLAQVQGQALAWCYDFRNNLEMENRGEEVAALHMALEKEGFGVFNEEKAGKEFGESTASAVSGLQQKYQDEILTPLGLKYGTGFLGKATRTKLNTLYGCSVKAVPAPFCSPIAVSCESGSKSKIICPSGLSEKGCPFPCKCVPVACTQEAKVCPDGSTVSRIPPLCEFAACPNQIINQPPVIYGINGPTFLKVNEPGTWTVKASDPESGHLVYSVEWGDGSESQTAIFTHSYSKPGVYSLTFIVADSSGLSIKMGITVKAEETISSLVVYEQVKCLFKGSQTEQKCNSSGENYSGYGCSGIETCVIDIKGIKGDKLTWRSSCDGYAYTTMDGQNEYAEFKCTATSSNLPPIISGVSGPTALKMYETGTWIIKASDPEQGILTYSVSWGDYFSGTSQIYPRTPDYSQVTSFTHSYFKAGTYNPIFTVSDNKGLSAKTSISVNVEEVTGTGFVRFRLLDASLCPGCIVGTFCTPCPPESERTIYTAKITVYDEKGNYIATEDTSSGTALFKNLAYGNYTATFSAPGFETDKLSFMVGPNIGTDNTVNIKKSSIVPPVASSIIVLSPNGGELWEIGKTYTIQWKSENLPSGNNITIELLGSSGTKVLFSSIANNASSQNWTIPKDFSLGTYILKVISYAFSCGGSNSSCGDDSDRPFSVAATTVAKTCTELETSQKYYFNICSDAGYDNVCLNKFTGIYQGCTRNTNNDCTISNANAEQNILCPVPVTQKSITVLYPNSNESWEIGKTYEIKWTTTGYSPDGVVRIIITDENSGTENPIFNAYNKGSFSWTVSSIYQAHSNYKIKIVAPDEKYDKSDAPFSIVSAATGLKDIENFLASISQIISQLSEKIKELIGR